MKNLKKFEIFSRGESANWKFKIGDYVRIIDMNYVWISDDREFSNNQIFKIIDTGDNMSEMEDQYILLPIDDENCDSVILANDSGIEFLTDEEIEEYKIRHTAYKYNL